MTRKIKYEIEMEQQGINPPIRKIKINGAYLGDACPCCGRGGIFEFQSKEMAKKYLNAIKKIREKNILDQKKQKKWKN